MFRVFPLLALALVPQHGRAPEREAPPSLEDLQGKLRDERPEARRSAVRGLADLAMHDGWELVLEALNDPDPQVADEAQVQLARVGDAKTLASLYGRAGLRAKDPWVRLRVAEVFGRLAADVDGEALVEGLSRSDPEASRAILWSLERAERRLTGDRAEIARAVLAVLEGRGEPKVRGAALIALAELDPTRALPAAEAALADDESAVRCAALIALRRLGPAGELDLVQRAVDDPVSAVRLHAIESLERLATKNAVALLVQRLAAEPRSRLRWRIAAALQHLSGLKHRVDPRPWRAWLAELPSDWSPGSRRPPDVAPGDRTSAFAGLPILSDRICFLIDFSGSLWQTEVAGRTRKEIAVDALAAALASLPEGIEFNLIPYTGEPIPWQERLAANSERNVRAAVEFLRACNASGKGNFYDAARLALSDPGVDTIVAYTDGVPTGGRRWNLDLMVELLAEEDRYHQVAFDAVLVDCKSGQRKRWERLAQATGGRVVDVETE